MKLSIKILCFLLSAFFLFACEENQTDKKIQITGLWIQERITENDVELPEENASILIESNGVYRTYAKNAQVKEHYGAWTITDATWLELTVDTWRMQTNPLDKIPEDQWFKNHILTRFTILKLSNSQLEIRIRTYEGERKYSALFVENTPPLLTESNFTEIDTEYKTLKTYIYTFRKKVED